MAPKYKKLISEYCAANGVTVPIGFGRNRPNRYAIVRTHLTPQKLVATTWFKVADVLYFIEHHLAPELGDALPTSIQILDFQTTEIFSYNRGKQLSRIGTFSLP